MYDGAIPYFGAMLIFELHEHNQTELVRLYGHSNLNSDETHSINIFYLNDTNRNPYQFKIPACSHTEICTVKQFLTSIVDYAITPEDWIKECKIDMPVQQGYNSKLGIGKTLFQYNFKFAISHVHYKTLLLSYFLLINVLTQDDNFQLIESAFEETIFF